jgi:hypothetical protein
VRARSVSEREYSSPRPVAPDQRKIIQRSPRLSSCDCELKPSEQTLSKEMRSLVDQGGTLEWVRVREVKEGQGVT